MPGSIDDAAAERVVGGVIQDDVELVARLLAGDEQAFGRLVADWTPPMLRVARSFVRTAQSAEDVVQDAWLGVLHGLERFEGRSSLRSWVFTILANRARSRGVKDARTVAWSQLGPEESGPTVDPARFRGPDDPYPGHWTSEGVPQRWDESPERSALAREAIAEVERALATLPERQQLVVTLRDVHGLTSEEVCAILEITPENQRVLLHRARAALRRSLEVYYRGR